MITVKLKQLTPFFILGLLTLIFFWKILLTNLILVGVDVFLYFYPYKAYAAQSLLAGRFPLWNPHIFMGVPFLANSQAGLLYPLNWLFLWAEPPKQVAYSIGLHIWIAGAGAYCFAQHSLKLNPTAALAGGLVFAFSGFLGAQVEHINQLQVSAWLPWIFLLFDQIHSYPRDILSPGARRSTLVRLLTKQRFWQKFALLSLIIALMLLAGHTQSVYISLFGLGIYGLFRRGIPWGRPNQIISRLMLIGLDFIPLILAIILALLLSAAQLLPTLELAQLSIRGGGLDYFDTVAFSLNPFKIFYTLFPPYGIDLEAKLGQAFSEFVAYVGLIPMFLAGLAIFHLGRTRQQDKWGLGITGAAGLFLAFGVFTGPVYFFLYLFVPGFNLFRVPARWLLLYTFAMAILTAVGFDLLKEKKRQMVILGLIFLELFIAAQGLRYNRPTAPEAYSSLRPAIVQLKAAQQPTDRFLSLSGIVYDPGDLKEIHHIFDNQLPPRAIYDYVIATKEKEVLFFNLPMIYGLNAVDGYDGGLLPLKRFIDLQKLFLPEDNLSIDGRLREKLDQVPSAPLLSLLGVRHIITDKVYDVWLDDIFYDLQFPAYLNPVTTSEIWTTAIPNFPASAIGLVYHTPVVEGTVAQVIVRYTSGLEKRFDLEAKMGRPWENEAFGLDYNVVFNGLPVNSEDPIAAIGLVAQAEVTVRGVSLIQPANSTSRSIILTTEGNYRAIHSGDVKIYENLNVLPRAFVMHQAKIITDTNSAVTHLQAADFDFRTTLVCQNKPDEEIGLSTLGQPNSGDNVTITTYTPEKIELSVKLNSPGWLVLTDTYYPGWQAYIDHLETEILQTNIMFRAIKVPAGQHHIIFRYVPGSFYLGLLLSLAGFSIFIVLLSVRKN
jgi:hypothetical protein